MLRGMHPNCSLCLWHCSTVRTPTQPCSALLMSRRLQDQEFMTEEVPGLPSFPADDLSFLKADDTFCTQTLDDHGIGECSAVRQPSICAGLFLDAESQAGSAAVSSCPPLAAEFLELHAQGPLDGTAMNLS